MSVEELNNLTDQYLEEDSHDEELKEYYQEGWHIRDKKEAEKIDYVIGKLEEQIAEDEEIAESRKKVLQEKIDKLEDGKSKIDEWLDRSTKKDRETIEHFKTHLHIYHQRLIDEETRENEKRVAEGKKPKKITSTIKLPNHDLTRRSQQPDYIKDDDELLKWAELNIPEADFSKMKKTLNWGAFKKYLQIDGTGCYYLDSNTGEMINVPIEIVSKPDKFDWKKNI